MKANSRKPIVVTFTVGILLIIVTFTIIYKILQADAEITNHINSLGRIIGMHLVSERNCLVSMANIRECGKLESPCFGYKLLLNENYKIEMENKTQKVWGIYLPTKIDFLYNMFATNSELAIIAFDNLSVQRTDISTGLDIIQSWKR